MQHDLLIGLSVAVSVLLFLFWQLKKIEKELKKKKK